MFKLIALLLIFGLLPLLISCGDRSKNADVTVDTLAPEQRLRTELDQSWSFCRQQSSESVRYLLDIQGEVANITAHLYQQLECAGKEYDSYRLAKFNHNNLIAQDRYQGTSNIKLNHFFPNRKPFEENVVRIGDGIVISAQTKLFFNSDYSQLQIVLKDIQTIKEAQLRDVNGGKLDENQTPTSSTANALIFNFVKSESLFDEFDGIKTCAWRDSCKLSFENQDAAKSWLFSQASKVVSKNCIDNYFRSSGPSAEEPPFEYIGGLFKNKGHLNLTEKGFYIRELIVFSLQDQNGNPFLGFYFYYYGDASSPRKNSGIACPIKIRPLALRFQQ